MKSYKTQFAVAGAALIAVMFAVVNIITTPGFLWCIFPIYAVTWWPLGVVLCGKKHYLAFALAGSLLTLALLAAVNLIVTPQYLWFLYIVPVLLIIPAGVHLRGRMISVPVAVLFSVLLILYFTIINLLLTPGRFWAVYPVYAALWWPLSLCFRNKPKPFSVAGSLITIVFLIATNLMETPYPWALYACPPVVFWPLAMYAGKRFGRLAFSVAASAVVIAYYGALNALLEPLSPWVMFVAFGVLWWPLSVYFYGRKSAHGYAAVMSALSIVFLAAVNMVYSPGALWAHYPAFAILWWPMTLLFARYKKWLAYAVAATLLSIVFFAVVNVTTSPGFPWSVFPCMAMLWWPLALGFKRKPLALSLAGAILVIATLLTINLITSPGFLWSLFAALGVLWWPAAVVCRKSATALSVVGSLLVIALVVTVNVITSPGFPWSVFAVFGVLWWPLSVGFHNVRKKRLAAQSPAG